MNIRAPQDDNEIRRELEIRGFDLGNGGRLGAGPMPVSFDVRDGFQLYRHRNRTDLRAGHTVKGPWRLALWVTNSSEGGFWKEFALAEWSEFVEQLDGLLSGGFPSP